MGAARFERATSRVLAECSDQLSYAPRVIDASAMIPRVNGSLTWQGA
jgi:hypothetical protein